MKAFDPDLGINHAIKYILKKIVYEDQELSEPFLSINDLGNVVTTMEIDRESYDGSNFFEVFNALCNFLMLFSQQQSFLGHIYC